MDCDFDYCIFNKASLCILEDIQINSLGMCEDCIMASTPEKLLNELKEKQLKSYIER